MLTGKELGRAIEEAIQRKKDKEPTFSQAQLARHFQIAPPSVQDWIKRGTIDKSKLVELWRLFSDVVGPEHWGLRAFPNSAPDHDERPSFSRGPSLAAEPPTSFGMQPIKAWEHEDELPEGEFVMVPRLEVHLSAGTGTQGSQVEIEFNEKQPQAFRAEWIRQQRLKPKKLAAMTAKGNSMEPTIHNGDSLLVDTTAAEVIDGRVYALWYEGGERVKRLYRMPGGGLRIRSDNAAEHPEIIVGPEYTGHVRIIGRVVHRSGTGGL